MLNFYKLIEILVSLQLLVITSMLPVYIPLNFIYKSSNNFELPITWQIPTIILLTLIFHKKVVVIPTDAGNGVIRDKRKTPDNPVVVPINPPIVDKINASIKN